ncbi:MAG: peptidoglycan DD-metalloendopeptidase family protein, partial [Oscillospiraceae bacterium]|nr:peptidoglycan DD-metalloendopeptidase family protein [Oscillospiraceae bacterium]
IVNGLDVAYKDMQVKKAINESLKAKAEARGERKTGEVAAIEGESSDVGERMEEGRLALSGLDAREAELEDEQAYLAGLIKELQAKKEEEDRAKAKAEADRKAREEAERAARERQGQGGGNVPSYISDTFVWPCKGHTEITSPYGMRYHPIFLDYRMHTGVDVRAGSGVAIQAAAGGTVIMAGWTNAYGNTVIIDHGGGVSTLYGHGSRMVVKEGQYVSAGQHIADVGSTGFSTGPHLHFEVRVSGDPVDPMRYFRQT